MAVTWPLVPAVLAAEPDPPPELEQAVAATTRPVKADNIAACLR
jgi:hypothetical protein